MIVSDGRLVKTPLRTDQLDPSWFPYMPGMSSPLDEWQRAGYGRMYERQLWVYVVVAKRARATARLPLPVYLHDEQNRPREDDHPMAKLLRQPRPGLSGFGLWQWTSSVYDIYGDAVWFKRRDRNDQVVELWPLHPTRLRQNPDGETWDFSSGKGGMAGIPSTDLVWFRSFNPASTTRGFSALEPLRATLENEWAARTATSSFWARGARPSLALRHPKNLSKQAQDRLRDQMDAMHSGSSNTGSVLILEEGLEASPFELSAEEAQYIETRKLNREEVCAAYDVPPPVVHILDRATFSNITEQMRSMYRDTMAPHLSGFEAGIETDLRMVDWPDDPVYAEFLLDGVLRGDFEARQAALAKASHMTIAEKRKVENLPFIEGTDRIFLNTATLPLDAIDAQAAALTQPAAAAPEGEPDDEPEAGAMRALLGRLSWQKALGDVDVPKVCAGLPTGVVMALVDAMTDAADVDEVRTHLKAIAKEEA